MGSDLFTFPALGCLLYLFLSSQHLKKIDPLKQYNFNKKKHREGIRCYAQMINTKLDFDSQVNSNAWDPTLHHNFGIWCMYGKVGLSDNIIK